MVDNERGGTHSMENKKPYLTPELFVLGNIEVMTQQSNKIGGQADVFSQQVPIVGSIVPVQK